MRYGAENVSIAVAQDSSTSQGVGVALSRSQVSRLLCTMHMRPLCGGGSLRRAKQSQRARAPPVQLSPFSHCRKDVSECVMLSSNSCDDDVGEGVGRYRLLSCLCLYLNEQETETFGNRLCAASIRVLIYSCPCPELAWPNGHGEAISAPPSRRQQ